MQDGQQPPPQGPPQQPPPPAHHQQPPPPPSSSARSANEAVRLAGLLAQEVSEWQEPMEVDQT